MRSRTTSRRDRTSLLARPPCHAGMYDDRWADLLVNPVDQLLALDDLLARGLLSTDEFERQKAKILNE
jgi:putative oligomerization/nucleic acid binding protein